jgi:hypothetical protein
MNKIQTIALMTYPTADKKRSGERLGDTGEQQLDYAWKEFGFPQNGFDYIFIDNSIFSQQILAHIFSLTKKRTEPVKIVTSEHLGPINEENFTEMVQRLEKPTLIEFEKWKIWNLKSRADIEFRTHMDFIMPHIYMSMPGMTMLKKNVLIFQENMALQQLGISILEEDSMFKEKSTPSNFKEFLSGISLEKGEGITIKTNSVVTLSIRKQLPVLA